MKQNEINIVFEDVIKNNDHDNIDNRLDRLSPDDLYVLANNILESRHRFGNYALVSITTRLFDDTPEFCKLLFKFLEKTSPDLSLDPLYKRLEEKVVGRPHEALSLVRAMLDLGNTSGESSGIILSLLVKEMDEAKDFMAKGLSSNDVPLQRCSLMALHSLLYGSGRNSGSYLNLLKKVAPYISPKNTHFLIRCLQRGFEENADEFRPILEAELIRRGPDAAKSYVRIAVKNSNASTTILQKAVEILEAEVPNSKCIDFGLAKMYEKNPDFVVERIKARLLKRGTIELMDYGSLDAIEKFGFEHVIGLVESLIDEGKLTQLHTNEILLRNLFLPAENWIAWCERWCNDERKELVILNSLRIILTDLINNKPSKTRDRAVKLAKFFAKKKDRDYEKETKGIVYGEGNENKEQAIRALHVLKVIQSPRGPDATTLTNNLKKAPHLMKVLGEKRANELIKKASLDTPHILAYIFSQKLDGVEELLPSQLYWENVFKVLDERMEKIPKKKLDELMNDDNILAEFEVFSRLAPFFEITIEPKTKKLGENKTPSGKFRTL